MKLKIKTANPKFKFLYSKEARKTRHIVMASGRSGGKSFAIVDYLITEALANPVKILVIRDIKLSLRDSVWGLIKQRVSEFDLEEEFTFTNRDIKSSSGAIFLFLGADVNPQSFKSLAGIDLTFVEEGAYISKDAFDLLTPSVTRAGTHYKDGRLIYAFNPENYEDAIYQKFFVNTPPPKTHIIWCNYLENKYCPEGSLEEAEHCRLTNPDDYDHIWMGGLKKVSDDIIFKHGEHWEIGDLDDLLEPDQKPYLGADYGSDDPTCCIVSYLSPDKKILYIKDEVYESGIPLEKIPEFFKQLPEVKRGYKIIGDNNLMIADYLMKHLNLVKAKKPPGSIIGGISYLRSKKIFIHPRCVNVYNEFRNYRLQLDREGQPIPDKPIDKYNHAIDAIRYSLQEFWLPQRKIHKTNKKMLKSQVF